MTAFGRKAHIDFLVDAHIESQFMVATLAMTLLRVSATARPSALTVGNALSGRDPGR